MGKIDTIYILIVFMDRQTESNSHKPFIGTGGLTK